MGPWLESVPAAQVALLMVSLQQSILGLGWLSAAAMMGPHRIGALWAAMYAMVSGAGIGAFVIAIGFEVEWLRVVGNLSGLAAMIGLHSAARAFIGQKQAHIAQAVLMAAGVAALLALWLVMRQDPLRIAVSAGLVVTMALWTAVDVWAFARRELSLRWGVLFATPLLFTAAVFSIRLVRAAAHVGEPMVELVANDSSRVGLATVTMVAALLVQVTLVSLLVIDADHFKQINDRHGHAAGDRALQHLAGVMCGTLRDIDRLGRWGGEEFVVLLPATRVDDACVLAERLRERVAASPAPWGGGLVPLTVSLGAAQWQPGDDAETVLHRADQALYRAKNAGRNRVMQ